MKGWRSRIWNGRRVLWLVCFIAALWSVVLAVNHLPKLGLVGDVGHARVHSCREQSGGPGVSRDVCRVRWLTNGALDEADELAEVEFSSSANPGDTVEVRRGMWGTYYAVETDSGTIKWLAASILVPAGIAAGAGIGALVLHGLHFWRSRRAA